MKPKAIFWFEGLLLPAIVIDLINNMVSFDPGTTNPFAVPRWVALLLFAVPSLIGLLFWYFIARRRSVVARWLFVGLVSLGALGFVATLSRPYLGTTMWAVAAFNELLKIGAAVCLLLPSAGPWFGKRARPVP